MADSSARIETSSWLSSGSRVVTRCSHSPGCDALRHRDQKRQKQDHPNRAVGHVEGNQVFEKSIMTLQDRCQVQGQKLVEQNKEPQRERQVQRQYPVAELRLLLLTAPGPAFVLYGG